MTTDIFLYKKDTTVTHSVRTRYRGATLVNIHFHVHFKNHIKFYNLKAQFSHCVQC